MWCSSLRTASSVFWFALTPPELTELAADRLQYLSDLLLYLCRHHLHRLKMLLKLALKPHDVLFAVPLPLDFPWENFQPFGCATAPEGAIVLPQFSFEPQYCLTYSFDYLMNREFLVLSGFNRIELLKSILQAFQGADDPLILRSGPGSAFQSLVNGAYEVDACEKVAHGHAKWDRHFALTSSQAIADPRELSLNAAAPTIFLVRS